MPSAEAQRCQVTIGVIGKASCEIPPRCSMRGIFTYIWLVFLCKYTSRMDPKRVFLQVLTINFNGNMHVIKKTYVLFFSRKEKELQLGFLPSWRGERPFLNDSCGPKHQLMGKYFCSFDVPIYPMRFQTPKLSRYDGGPKNIPSKHPENLRSYSPGRVNI